MAENPEEVTFVPEEEAQKQAAEPTPTIEAEVQQLEEGIVKDLQELKSLTGNSGAWFWRGIMQGAGAIVGSIAMLILLGWLLSVLGVIPGLGDIANYIRHYYDQVHH